MSAALHALTFSVEKGESDSQRYFPEIQKYQRGLNCVSFQGDV